MDLLERDEVLHRLQELVVGAHDGDGRIALIRGEAGIGKTSVARELIRLVADDSHVLWGACDDLLAPRPLGPVWDMSFDEPALSEAVASRDHDSVFEVFMELFTRALRPTVAVFEDVHWADGATLDLLTSLGRRIDRTNTVMVLTFREWLPAGHPLGVVLGDLPQTLVENEELGPLSHDAVLALSDGTGRGDRIWDLSSGNPFYVSELLASTQDEIPVSVTDVIRSHVARLTAKGENLVRLASVVPGRMELSLLDEIDASLTDSIEEAENRGLLGLDGDSVAFRHELARSAVETSLTEPVRRELNMKVLRGCEALEFDVARSAHHAIQAQDVDAMLRLLPEAARQAAETGSHREVVTNLKALEPHLGDVPLRERAALYELWATEEELVTGRGLDQALLAVKIRKQLGDLTGVGAALLRAAKSAWAQGELRSAVTLTGKAVDVLEEVGGEPLAEAYASLADLRLWDDLRDAAAELAEKALDIAPRRSRARAIALTTIGVIRNSLRYPAGVESLREAEQISRSLGLEREWQEARCNRIVAASRNEHIDVARRLNEQAIEEIGDETLAECAEHLNIRAMIAISSGDYEAASTTLRTLDQSQYRGGWLDPHIIGARAELLVRMGDPTAREALLCFSSVGDSIQLTDPQPWHKILWAHYLWAFGRRDEAITRSNLEILAKLRTPIIDSGVFDLAVWLWLDGHIEVIPNHAATEQARWLSTGNWRQAAEWYRKIGNPYEEAISLSLGDSEARLEALAIVDRIGAKALSARFRRQLRSEGVKGVPRRRTGTIRSNPLGLTRRQSEVLELLAEGLTNREIAQRLFISPRTVEKHVAALLTKLGVPDRRAAVSQALELDLIETLSNS